MNLLNVRKGQFVYCNNQLHKVYGVKPFFKRSVHLIRLEDFEQQLATAKEIDLYKPKHLDSFICNGRRYTLNKNVRAEVGDYILVINPKPDSIDHHHLHAIEIVTATELNGVISNKANGIKHNEYWVMVPGLEEGATIIDFQKPDSSLVRQEKREQMPSDLPEIYPPKIGDVYQKNDNDPLIQAMVIAIKGRTIYLGGGHEVTMDELANAERWSYVFNFLEQ